MKKLTVWEYNRHWVAAYTKQEAIGVLNDEVYLEDEPSEIEAEIKRLPIDSTMDFAPSICGDDVPLPADWEEGEDSRVMTMREIIAFQSSRGAQFPGLLARGAEYC